MRVVTPDPPVKPRLRGVSHAVAFFVALGGCVLLASTPTSRELHLGGIVYGASLVLLFGASSLYHTPMWSREMRRRLRKVDHAGIFFLIAGTYTPLALQESGGAWTTSLSIMWGCALTGALFALFWAHAPRAVKAVMYVALGLFSAPVMFHLPATIGWFATSLLLVSSAVYIAGAGVYAKRWPNPAPATFGYHEVFHVMVIVAASVQFGVVHRVLRAAAA